MAILIYFVVSTWEDPPRLYLIRRNSQEAVEVAGLDVPEGLRQGFLQEAAQSKGVYPPDEGIKAWLKSELAA
ncbi:MAG: hypothetical protein JW821_10005 [Deltaproteobacteria bacterium]|nr:hypothetical protein [Deltaproteobacteria bacterium]